jgi:hypothetical protein
MMVGLACALAAWAATGPPDAAAAGLARLAAAAREALDQRRRWSGPSSQALARLIEGELLAGRPASAARLATPAPDGEARGDEASADEVVILGTRAALLAGDRDRGEALAARAASEHAAEAVGALLAGQDLPPRRPS